jgi:hypothetical protein
MTHIDTALAAFMLNSTRRHVQKLVAKGVLPNYGDARAIRIDLDDLDRGIIEGRIQVLHQGESR